MFAMQDPQASQHNGGGAQVIQEWPSPSWDLHNPSGSDPILNMMTGEIQFEMPPISTSPYK